MHDTLGALTPDAEMIAQAVSAQSGDRLAPSAAAAANRLGLATQIPARASYATTGRTRMRQAAGRRVTLKHSRALVLGKAAEVANGVVQYLAGLGLANVDADAISQLVARLDEKDVQALLKGRAQMAGWLGKVVHKIGAVRCD